MLYVKLYGARWLAASESVRERTQYAFPGPPSVPPDIPFKLSDVEDPRQWGRYHRWPWIAGVVFASMAALLTARLLPNLEPSAFFAGLAAFLTTTAFWLWERPERDVHPVRQSALLGSRSGS